MDIHIQQGWSPEQADLVAGLYDEAFGAKFERAIPDKAKRLVLLAGSFEPDFSFVALQGDRIVGLAGFQESAGSLTGGLGASQLIDTLGVIRGLWACCVFALFERQPEPGELVMDGIAVDRSVRGQGIGSALLDRITGYAADNGFRSVRLDVIDSNPRARKLYESKGFVATRSERFPYLAWLIGFSGATTMVLDVQATNARNI